MRKDNTEYVRMIENPGKNSVGLTDKIKLTVGLDYTKDLP